MKNIVLIARDTIYDELHHKSFYLLTAVSILFIFMIRGCFESRMTMNGRQLDTATMGWYISIAAFQVISWGTMLLAALLSMRLFRIEKENGNTVFYLSKPLTRSSYLTGKIAGIFLLTFAFMFILHLTVNLIMLSYSGGRIPGYLLSSCVSSLNLLFVIVLVLFFSFFVPDFMAAFTAVVIGIISLFSDSIYALMQSQAVKGMVDMTGSLNAVPLWRIFWPKIAGVQYYCSSLIKGSEFHTMGPVHPAVNVAIYTVIIILLLYIKFTREEIR